MNAGRNRLSVDRRAIDGPQSIQSTLHNVANRGGRLMSKGIRRPRNLVRIRQDTEGMDNSKRTIHG